MNYLLSETFKSHLENLSFISGIVVATAALFGLRQLSLFKKDIHLRNERAAKERAIEYSQRYLNVFCQLDGVFHAEVKKAGLSSYKGEIGDFTRSSLPERLPKNSFGRMNCTSCVAALNELCALSAAFVAGVADEQVGFKIIGRTFCGAVQQYYDLLAIVRTDPVHAFYGPIVELYKVWSPRLTRAELEQERTKIVADINAQVDNPIQPIGYE